MTHRLALFDCDGTLADSQHEIVAAMHRAFAMLGLSPPHASAIRTNIGLSLPGIAAKLLPNAGSDQQAKLVDAYREAYFEARTAPGAEPEPLYDGIRELLDKLSASGWTLGVATGKSRRGLDRLLAAQGIAEQFATLQTADVHPSKPHPAMVEAACAETCIAASDTIVIGDTAFDMAMAVNGGTRAIGVAWGYHDAPTLVAAGAEAIAETPEDLLTLLEQSDG
jgi:phosphoglycolate phosphatase